MQDIVIYGESRGSRELRFQIYDLKTQEIKSTVDTIGKQLSSLINSIKKTITK